MSKKSRFLNVPIEPFGIDPQLRADELLQRMERISFQGRNLATAHRVWQKMLDDDVTIFLGVAGALSADVPGHGHCAAHRTTIRGLCRVDGSQPVSRSSRNTRAASLRRLADGRRPLPLLASALARSARTRLANRVRPAFEHDERHLRVDGTTFSSDRFEEPHEASR